MQGYGQGYGCWLMLGLGWLLWSKGWRGSSNPKDSNFSYGRVDLNQEYICVLFLKYLKWRCLPYSQASTSTKKQWHDGFDLSWLQFSPWQSPKNPRSAEIFKLSNHFFIMALEYFLLDGWVTEHVRTGTTRCQLSLVGKLGASLLKGLSVEFPKWSEMFENLEMKELHKSVSGLKWNFIEDWTFEKATLSPIVMDVKNGRVWKVTILLEGSHFALNHDWKGMSGYVPRMQKKTWIRQDTTRALTDVSHPTVLGEGTHVFQGFAATVEMIAKWHWKSSFTFSTSREIRWKKGEKDSLWVLHENNLQHLSNQGVRSWKKTRRVWQHFSVFFWATAPHLLREWFSFQTAYLLLRIQSDLQLCWREGSGSPKPRDFWRIHGRDLPLEMNLPFWKALFFFLRGWKGCGPKNTQKILKTLSFRADFHLGKPIHFVGISLGWRKLSYETLKKAWDKLLKAVVGMCPNDE